LITIGTVIVIIVLILTVLIVLDVIIFVSLSIHRYREHRRRHHHGHDHGLQLNPGIRYVQGMNELLAPLYYVFAQDPDPAFQCRSLPPVPVLLSAWSCRQCRTGCILLLHASGQSPPPLCRTPAGAESPICLQMSELKDRFIESLDGSDSGIVSCIDEFKVLLRLSDPDLFLHLVGCLFIHAAPAHPARPSLQESSDVDANFYSLRWLTLLLSQEFPLPDVLRIWDSLLSDPRRYEFLYYICCSMLM
jgi:hypothetical protein